MDVSLAGVWTESASPPHMHTFQLCQPIGVVRDPPVSGRRRVFAHGEVGLLLTRTESLRTTVSEEATRLLIAAFLVTSTNEIISRLSTLWRV
jgi:hypothetical protein